MPSTKVDFQTALQTVRRQGAQILRSEAYLSYAATTKDAAQRGMRTFYEVVVLKRR